MNTRSLSLSQAASAESFTPLVTGILQRKCASCGQHSIAGGECTECGKKKQFLQRRAVNQAETSEVPPIVHDVLRSPGQSLDASTRAFMEPRFGHDFSGVRVHTDEKSAKSAQAVNALAYTVGRDVVFGAGQYAPGTTEGKKLLAHELTHTVQQGQLSRTTRNLQAKLEMASQTDSAEQQADIVARQVIAGEPLRVQQTSIDLQHVSSGILQCTPAPPNYGGVTGVRDLSRIRIDAVPDFLASSLTAPRVVNVHINDPAVVHLSWEFYNPNDQMMSGSFSTLPGGASATTTPFTLEPSHFSGAGFVEGKYLLRCVGRNASHQPIIYADRDFNVLRSDLTTGTALPTTYGELTFTRYDKTDANPPANPSYSVDVELRFLPRTTVACGQVGFIQALQTVDHQGRSQQQTINPDHDARQTPLAWSIDRLVGGPTPFYGTQLGTGGAITIPATHGNFGAGGATPTAASLIDVPSWNRADTARFESCVICRNGGNRGQVYGCATWGYTANAAGQVTLMPRSFRKMPSDQFEEARVAWNTWRATRPAATQPEAAPALRSP